MLVLWECFSAPKLISRGIFHDRKLAKVGRLPDFCNLDLNQYSAGCPDLLGISNDTTNPMVKQLVSSSRKNITRGCVQIWRLNYSTSSKPLAPEFPFQIRHTKLGCNTDLERRAPADRNTAALPAKLVPSKFRYLHQGKSNSASRDRSPNSSYCRQ